MKKLCILFISVYAISSVMALNIESFAPTQGSIKGGQKVIIRGNGFSQISQVKFGQRFAKIEKKSDTEMELTPPSVPASILVNIIALDVNGNFALAPNRYFYQVGVAPQTVKVNRISQTKGKLLESFEEIFIKKNDIIGHLPQQWEWNYSSSDRVKYFKFKDASHGVFALHASCFPDTHFSKISRTFQLPVGKKVKFSLQAKVATAQHAIVKLIAANKIETSLQWYSKDDRWRKLETKAYQIEQSKVEITICVVNAGMGVTHIGIDNLRYEIVD